MDVLQSMAVNLDAMDALPKVLLVITIILSLVIIWRIVSQNEAR